MALLKGMVVGRGTATSATGTSVAYRLVMPDKSPENLQIIASEMERWQRTLKSFRTLLSQGKIPYEVVRRSEFGIDALRVLADNLRLRVCCQIVAQAYDGRILGLASYGFISGMEGNLLLQAIDPEHLAGSPGASQLRGIGSALVAAVARAFLITGRTRMNIHPLDEKAAIFWRNRGFEVCGGGGLMCVRTREGLLRLRNLCELLKDGPEGAENLICGLPREPRPTPAGQPT